MEKKFYVILISCGILSQGICNLAEENNGEKNFTKKSSDIHNRQKRVAGGTKRPFVDAPYLVAILSNGHFHSPATLLTADVAITSAQPFQNQQIPRLTLESRSAAVSHFHHLTRVIPLDPNFKVMRPSYKNLALVKFYPPINFQISLNRPIRIHSGSVAQQLLHFQVFSWARPVVNTSGLLSSSNLRSIPVQLISYDHCRELFPSFINADNICTYGKKTGQHCTFRDSGAPLLVENNLLGIMVYRDESRESNPDVFMNLLAVDIRRWIHEHVPSLRLF